MEGVLTGSSVGRFLIRARLGAGGMGEVYRAEDPRLNRTVAIKRLMLHGEPGASGSRQQLLKEAQRASALNHPGIAAVYDVFEDRDELFLVMEYVDGVTLRDRMASPLPMHEFLSIARQCTDALGAAHARGILHGDLKPANIMLTRDGHVKICDFGLARRVASTGSTGDSVPTTTARPGLAGTAAYMAPEVALEHVVDLRADLFSLGVVFYEMLSGRNPFAAPGTLATLDRVINHTPGPLSRLNPGVTPGLNRLVHRLLDKDPDSRHQSAADVTRELATLDAELQPATPRGSGWRIAAAAVAVTVLIASAGLVLPRLREAESEGPRAPLPGRVHLAVLPFTEYGAPASRPTFPQGFAEALTTRLSRLTLGRPLQVAAVDDMRTRSVTTADDARDQLGVTLALTGRLDYEPGRVTISQQLIDTHTARPLRSDVARVASNDPLAVQDRALEAAVRMLDLDLTADERRALLVHDTAQPGAYDFYLQARGYLMNFDRLDSLDSAITVFRRALELDRRYARAYAGLGEAYWRKHELTGVTTWVDPARAACEGAIGIDTDLADAHACLGMVLNGTGEYERAAAEYAIAAAREPSNDRFHAGLASAYERMGRQRDAEQAYRRAIELRPYYWAGYSALGAYFFRSGRYNDATGMFRQVVDLAPDSFRGYSSLGASLFMADRSAEAMAAFEKALAVRPNDLAASNLGTLLYYEGEYARAAEMFRQATALVPGNYVNWANLAGALERTNSPDTAAAYRETRRLVDERLAVNPRDAALLVAQAECSAALGEHAAARRSLERALALMPTQAHVLLEIAKFYEHRLRERAQALEWLRRAVAQGQTWREIDRSPVLTDLRRDPRFRQMRQPR